MNSKTWVATDRNAPSHRRSVLFTLMAGMWRLLRSFYERSRQRRHLIGLSDHHLRDIGLLRGDIELEWRKPFWRD